METLGTYCPRRGLIGRESSAVLTCQDLTGLEVGERVGRGMVGARGRVGWTQRLDVPAYLTKALVFLLCAMYTQVHSTRTTPVLSSSPQLTNSHKCELETTLHSLSEYLIWQVGIANVRGAGFVLTRT